MENRAFHQLPEKHHLHVLTGPNGSGKTRYLTWLAEKVLKELRGGVSDYRRLLCLSGTVHDRYSAAIWQSKSVFKPDCIYLGYRTNNNMFSEAVPFRTLFANMLYERQIGDTALSFAAAFLAELNLAPRVKFTSVRQSEKKPVHYLFDFERGIIPEVQEFDSFAKFSVSFERGDRELELNDLSSGQKWYVLAVLAACFCVHEDSLILIDEPENSLHPEWQLRILKRFTEALVARCVKYTMVVSTHSPLIASSLPNRSALICDLPQEQSWRQAALHGQTADTVLSNQFGVFSARSPVVLSLIQEGLRILAHGGANSEALQNVIGSLKQYDLALDPDDPLFETLETLMDFGGES